jgi:hypothetical protein
MMVRKTEQRFQAFLGNRMRVNEIDPRFITRDLHSLAGLIRLPYRLFRMVGYELLFEAWRRSPGKHKKVVRPILMYGLPHSGTSISMQLVAQHPDLVNYSEANTVLQPMGYFDYENGTHVRTKEDATPKEIERLQRRFDFRRWFFQKRRILNKSPNNSVRLDFLHAVFPDAVFIHVVRDGRAVVNSLIRGLPADWETEDRFKPWRERINPFPGVKPPNWRSLLRDNPLEQHALQWCEVINYAFKVEACCGIKTYHLKYEELCESPRSVIEKVYKFAGLSVSDEILKRIPEKLGSKNYKWKKEFSEKDLEIVNQIQEPLLNILGYEL